MAKIVTGIGMSHSPLVVTDGSVWPRFGEADRRSSLLIDTSGKPVTFADLEQVNGDRYASEAAPENLIRQSQEMRRAMQRLKDELAQERPDVVLVIGDDQMELLDFSNMPALAVFYGDELVACTRHSFGSYDRNRDMFRGMGMDDRHVWPGHQGMGLHLIKSLLEHGFDVGAMREVGSQDGKGIGHAFGVIETQLIDDQKIPLVPVFVNGYWPPNQPTPSRCYELGRAIRAAVESMPGELRVAVIASGGLSHFVTDERLDREVLEALRTGDERRLRDIPVHLLNSGNSEIRNWVTVAAACEDKKIAWDEYIPVYRTQVGTGCGLAFARWS